VTGVELRAEAAGRAEEVLSDNALAFVAELHRRFDPVRRDLLQQRRQRQDAFERSALPDFLPETAAARQGEWSVAPPPADLADRRVEITGPTDRKMVINALNSGAKVFMADFEDANSPTWRNMVDGQVNLIDAVAGTIELTTEDRRRYQLGDKVATLVVRPRGWHLDERHLVVDGRPASGSLFDVGLYVFHNAAALLEKGSGPYFYLPKLEGHLEARLWNEVFEFSEERLGLPAGSIKATVLIETILAAFEMEETLYELRDRSAALNAGRWDYIFSIIKKFRHRADFVLPDRAQVAMTVPFMRAYTELLVRTCHRRGAHAIGGMAAFIPSRRDPEVNDSALAAVRADKQREAGDGFDGTWVSHPDLVPIAMEVFDQTLGERPNQVDRLRDDVDVAAGDLLDVRVPDGQVTEAGVRGNVAVGMLYLESWLRGQGAAALFNLMEDTATAEIARSQLWQWRRHGTAVAGGGRLTDTWLRRVIDEELDRIRETVGDAPFSAGRFADARALLEAVSLGDEFVEFLTLPGAAHLD
jgi:malate synthase